MSLLRHQQMLMVAGGGGGLSFDDAVKADNPDAFWLLDETSGTTAANAMGASFPGTYSSVTLGGASLIPNDPSAKSVKFNLGNVMIPGTTTSLRGSAITYMIVFKHASSPDPFALLGNGANQPYLRVSGGKLDFLKSHAVDRLHGSTTFTVGNNYLVHCTVATDGTVKLYVNGVLDASTAASFDYVTSQPFAIGCDSDQFGSLSEFSNTYMSRPAVWAKTDLSAAQILAHAQAGGFA